MLRELGIYLREQYPHTPYVMLERGLAAVMHGYVTQEPQGYVVAIPDASQEAIDPPVATVTQAKEGWACDCDLATQAIEEEEEGGPWACPHIVAVTVLAYEQAYQVSLRTPGPEHSVTLGGFTPEGFSFLDCMRGYDLDQMRREMLRASKAYAEAGLLPDGRCSKRQAPVEPPAAKDTVTEAPAEARQAPPVQTNPTHGPAEQSGHETPVNKPLQATGKPTPVPAQAKSAPPFPRRQPAQPNYAGSFVTSTIRGKGSDYGTFWSVNGDDIPKFASKYGMIVSDKALAEVVDVSEWDLGQEYLFPGYRAWYTVDQSGKGRVQKFEALP